MSGGQYPPPPRIMSSNQLPRFEKFPTGSLFPVEHRLSDVRDGLLNDLRNIYKLESSTQKINIISVDIHGNQEIYALIPPHYEALVRRFLWRISVLNFLFFSSPQLERDVAFAIACNLRYSLDVLRFCRPAFRSAVEQRDPVRIPFFDAYMLEDHYVGRHEPSAVILWQREHPECNLRTADVTALGGYRPR